MKSSPITALLLATDSNFFLAEVTGFCDEINNEFEASGKYNFLVSQTTRPIAKSLPKTLDFKIHNLWRQNRLSKAKSPTLNTHEAFLCLAQSFVITRAQRHSRFIQDPGRKPEVEKETWRPGLQNNFLPNIWYGQKPAWYSISPKRLQP